MINVFELLTATFSKIKQSKNTKIIHEKCSHGSRMATCCHTNKLFHSGNKISNYKSSIKRPSLAVLPNVSSTKMFLGPYPMQKFNRLVKDNNIIPMNFCYSRWSIKMNETEISIFAWRLFWSKLNYRQQQQQHRYFDTRCCGTRVEIGFKFTNIWGAL